MRKDAQAVLLLLIGATLLKISFTGTYVRYVKPGQLPLLLIAGVVLIAIAGVTLWRVIQAPKDELSAEDQAALDQAEQAEVDDDPGFEHLAAEPAARQISPAAPPVEAAPKLSSLREPPRGDLAPMLSALREPDPPEPQEMTYREFTPGELVAVPASHHRGGHERGRERGAHERVREGGHPAPEVGAHDDELAVEEQAGPVHRHGEPRVAWLLLLPALALLMFAPPALGSYQASRNGTALSARADSDFPPLPAGDPLRMSMLDYAGRAVFDRGRSLAGRRITLSGFIISGPYGEPYLARMIVTCCAADGRPVKVGLAGDLPTALKPDEWIEVEGSFVDRADKDPVNGEVVPYIQVSAIHTIAAPEQQYES